MFNPEQYLQPVKNAHNPLYNKHEKAIIDKYEDEYRAATTPLSRRHVVVAQLCPELFNHWVLECEIPMDDINEAKRVNDILAYVRNNWRPTKSTKQYQPTFVVKRPDVVWDTMNNEVMVEIARLMGLDIATTSTRGWINHRSAAIGNIIKEMDEEELSALDAEVRRRTMEGNPEHLKRKLAAKYRFSRVSDTNRRNFLEMGILSLNFVAWQDEDGVWGIELHDGISAILNEAGSTFEERNANTVAGWKRQMLVYLDQTLAKKEGRKSILPDNDFASEGFEKYIDVDRATGFPKLKDTFRSFLKPKKQVEKLFRKYLTLQYYVATGRKHSVPYTRVINNISSFIGNEYLPQNFQFRDPRNVTSTEIQSFFEHIYERQQFLPIDQVFRFKRVTSTRNEGETVAAPYPPQGSPSLLPVTNTPVAPPDRSRPENVETEPSQRRQRKRREDTASVPNEITLDFTDMYRMSMQPEGENNQSSSTQPASIPDVPELPHSGAAVQPYVPQDLPGNNWEQPDNRAQESEYNANLALPPRGISTHWPSPNDQFIAMNPILTRERTIPAPLSSVPHETRAETQVDAQIDPALLGPTSSISTLTTLPRPTPAPTGTIHPRPILSNSQLPRPTLSGVVQPSPNVPLESGTHSALLPPLAPLTPTMFALPQDVTAHAPRPIQELPTLLQPLPPLAPLTPIVPFALPQEVTTHAPRPVQELHNESEQGHPAGDVQKKAQKRRRRGDDLAQSEAALIVLPEKRVRKKRVRDS